MTPDNDKTLRGLFHEHVIGQTEWNDRRDYRLKYEKTGGVNLLLSDGKRRSRFGFNFTIISPKRKRVTIIEDRERYPSFEEDEDYMIWLTRFFPELKACKKFLYFMTFGMAQDIDGYSACDSCGQRLHALNSNRVYGLCDDCGSDDKYNQEQFDIR